MRNAILALLALVIVLAAAACGDDDDVEVDGAPAPPYTVAITFPRDGGSPLLSVEIADTPEERAIGLMNRESMPEDAGMLFVYAGDSEATFWMGDTLIPLSIAFVRAGGTIIDIQDMAPQTENSHASPEPFRYAIEANQGWFADNGIAAGDRVDLSPIGATASDN